MANYNEHKCLVCGQVFEYCRHCVVTPIVYKAEGFCSEKCSDIFNILSKHSCNLISADEAFVDLTAYDLDGITLSESILTHIEKIESEVGAAPVVEAEPIVEITEKVVEESSVQSNKNKKKKW